MNELLNPEFIRRRDKVNEILGFLDQKQLAYDEAIEQNQPEVADKIMAEFYDLVTELRFVDPEADLSKFERGLVSYAEALTRHHHLEAGKKTHDRTQAGR